jgi:putative polyketide hydroxylase
MAVDLARLKMIQAETLASEEYTVVEAGASDSLTSASPSPFLPIDQDRLEIVLRRAAEDAGSSARFYTELVSFEQDADGVTAAVRDRRDGAERFVSADYLSAADGYASPTRRRLGIGTEGPGPLYHTLR